ncbi:MAG: TetR family transcriptional regulator [Oceanospirillaceae bacterium]|nr:TetR family transcriptional regulator [Oceanospirillaceae bacterium]MEC9409780.1 TetR family transcriptional regulator [Pseudomonadota bacterium]
MNNNNDSRPDQDGKAELKYRGRRTSREKSEQRRRQILEATMRIIVRDGVRGVRHRAVAAEAEVPLAATTYYFKDIHELIADAFTLYTEWALAYVQKFAAEFRDTAREIRGYDMTDPRQQLEAIERLVTSLSGFSRGKLAEDTRMLISEQAFRYEVFVEDRVRRLALMHRKALTDAVREITMLMGSQMVEEDTAIVMAILHSVEYQLLLDEGDSDAPERILRRYLSMLLPMLVQPEL